MSHFTVLVFSKIDKAEMLLEPFNENEEVEEYCSREVSEEDRDEFMKYYQENNISESLGKSFEELYEIFGESWNGNAWRPNDDGVWCSYSTYNPDSKWDWYVMGGRWDNAIPKNYCKASKIPEDFVPFAFIDQDGEWHEKGHMGWWAYVTEEKMEEDWKKEFKDALKEYGDNHVVLFDCHI